MAIDKQFSQENEVIRTKAVKKTNGWEVEIKFNGATVATVVNEDKDSVYQFSRYLQSRIQEYPVSCGLPLKKEPDNKKFAKFLATQKALRSKRERMRFWWTYVSSAFHSPEVPNIIWAYEEGYCILLHDNGKFVFHAPGTENFIPVGSFIETEIALFKFIHNVK